MADPDAARLGGEAAANGVWFRNLHTGAVIRAIGAGESLRAAYPNVARPQGRFGDLVRSLVVGRPVTPEIEEELRTMSIGTPSAGGYAVSEPYAVEFIDLARAQSSVIRAGAMVVPMDGNTLDMARITGDPTIGWKSENNAFSPSDLTLDRVTFTARTVGAIVKGSEELFMDSPNAGAMVEQALRQALGVEMDRVSLVGGGSAPEPQGVYGATNVQTYDVSATPTSYDFVSQMVQKIRTENFEPNAMIAHPRTYGTLDRLKDQQDQPLMPPKSFSDLTHYQSTSIPITLDTAGSPTATTASIAIAGKWNELMIGSRLNVMLFASRVSNDGTDSAFAKYQIHIRVVARMDVQLSRPKAFCVGRYIEA